MILPPISLYDDTDDARLHSSPITKTKYVEFTKILARNPKGEIHCKMYVETETVYYVRCVRCELDISISRQRPVVGFCEYGVEN